MNKFEYTISTQVIGTKDGRATYEVRKTLNNENGKRCVIIALYPTVSLIAPCVMDNSTLFLINRANELGYNDFRIVNIYSKVCKGKPSVKQLNKDDDNLAYLKSVFEEEKDNDDTDVIISWGTALKTNENTKNMKIEILKLLKKNISDNRIKQLSSKDLDTASLLTPHILWMGLHCKDVWFTEKVSVDDLLKLLGVKTEKSNTKKRTVKSTANTKDLKLEGVK